ncbi:fructosamine-3-kinase [Rhodovulum iodosum]|uniref:Fructosamine-3-kinase n=1 Tax=Rhodovulum iodosum TaxID=68291 RepID=A0ABV3XP57_9RHOB|nr:fructosamine kinase family protein [Rhodovulum robiginosum]RSK31592.1 aminoglycoside phosphotransferase [Rhodovulum robiginosum]
MFDRTALETLLDAAISRVAPLHGGDLSEVFAVTLEDGRTIAVKQGSLAMREARMLDAIGAVGVAAPQVLAARGPLLAMTYLDEGRAGPQGWAALGEELRQLHAVRGADYGWEEDYAFGPAALPNAATGDWPAFWAERRLMAWPEALPGDIARRTEALAARLPEMLPAGPAPALLHGDLWSGNVLFTAEGGAALIDPACYYGHAEVDLAMLHLFGAPGPGFADAYGALEPGLAERRTLYQLWPALVHLRLFGAGYRGMVERMLGALGA